MDRVKKNIPLPSIPETKQSAGKISDNTGQHQIYCLSFLADLG